MSPHDTDRRCNHDTRHTCSLCRPLHTQDYLPDSADPRRRSPLQNVAHNLHDTQTWLPDRDAFDRAGMLRGYASGTQLTYMLTVDQAVSSRRPTSDRRLQPPAPPPYSMVIGSPTARPAVTTRAHYQVPSSVPSNGTRRTSPPPPYTEFPAPTMLQPRDSQHVRDQYRSTQEPLRHRQLQAPTTTHSGTSRHFGERATHKPYQSGHPPAPTTAPAQTPNYIGGQQPAPRRSVGSTWQEPHPSQSTNGQIRLRVERRLASLNIFSHMHEWERAFRAEYEEELGRLRVVRRNGDRQRRRLG